MRSWPPPCWSCSGTRYPESLEARYKVTVSPEQPGWELLEQCARKRGMLISGGQADTERMARVLLDEFRGGKLGRFTLETPEDLKEGTEGVSVGLGSWKNGCASRGFPHIAGTDEPGRAPWRGGFTPRRSSSPLGWSFPISTTPSR